MVELNGASSVGGGGADLPAVTSDDNGKALMVKEGAWDKDNIPTELPAVTSDDNNKVLKVTEGAWTVGDVPVPATDYVEVTATDLPRTLGDAAIALFNLIDFSKDLTKSYLLLIKGNVIRRFGFIRCNIGTNKNVKYGNLELVGSEHDAQVFTVFNISDSLNTYIYTITSTAGAPPTIGTSSIMGESFSDGAILRLCYN